MLQVSSAAVLAVCLLLNAYNAAGRQLENKLEIPSHEQQEIAGGRGGLGVRLAGNPTEHVKGRSLSYRSDRQDDEPRSTHDYYKAGTHDYYKAGRSDDEAWDEDTTERTDVAEERDESGWQSDRMQDGDEQWRNDEWAARDQGGGGDRFDDAGSDRFNDGESDRFDDGESDRLDDGGEDEDSAQRDRDAQDEDEQPWQHAWQSDSGRQHDLGAGNHDHNNHHDHSYHRDRRDRHHDVRRDRRDSSSLRGQDVSSWHKHDDDLASGHHHHDHSWSRDVDGNATDRFLAGECGTPVLTPEEVKLLQGALDEAKQWWVDNKDEVTAWLSDRFAGAKRLWKEKKPKWMDESQNDAADAKQPSATIPVYFHTLTSRDASGAVVGSVTKDQLNRQMEMLNQAYAPVGLKFEIAAWRTRSVDTAYYTACNGDDAGDAIKRQLRNSDNALELNIYTWDLSNCESGNSGYATFPPSSSNQKVDRTDGVVSNFKMLPGGERGYGISILHEVAHWLSVFHTFQGGCGSPGDAVSDTPAQAEPIKSCDANVATDTCGEGVALIYNYMNYAPHKCRSTFTPGQYERLRLGYQLRVEIDFKQSKK